MNTNERNPDVTTRTPNIDQHGVHHRPGCARPGWSCTTAGRAGVHVLRCACCGAVRLVRASDGTRKADSTGARP